ncbi:MAG: glycerophosphodiester phosphodiesterase, partial [Actinomycetales bacterium]
GFSAKFPEATMAAYQGAVTAGADGFECDIRLSKEGMPVCFHDRTTLGIAGKFKFVGRTSLAELRDLVSVITLDELIELARKKGKDILIETKHPVFAGGKVESAVLARVSGISDIRITLMSFSLLAVKRFQKKHQDVAYVIAHRWRMLLIPTKTVAVDVELFAKSKWVRDRLNGKEVFLWTVNEKRYIKELAPWKVAGVITDKPDLPFRLG